LDDSGYVPQVRAKVIVEREKWNVLFDRLQLHHTESRGNFVFFETGRPHNDVAQALRAQGIEIARAFPPLDTWVRIAIGLPRENALARAAIAKLLS
jgi:histidinol-phosphate aminotransferase